MKEEWRTIKGVNDKYSHEENPPIEEDYNPWSDRERAL